MYAMFYGQMAETTASIELPDCDYESLLEMFSFMYTDEANLSGRNVVQVIFNNYSPKWRWLVMDIYRAAKRRGKYQSLSPTLRWIIVLV